MGKAKKIVLNVFKWIGIVLAAIVVIFAALVIWLTITEYKPEQEIPLKVERTENATATFTEGSSVTLMSWNIGYGALDETADFFMDGGTHVSSATKEMVKENVNGINGIISSVNPDIAIFQEVDVKSTRSHKVNELEKITDAHKDYDFSYAPNYRVPFIPFPVPPIGKVECGLVTLAKEKVSSALRVQLPCPFSWPARLANLKRCLLVSRIPVEGTNRQVVIVNLHLEAYDSGDGKIAQTKQLRKLLEDEAAKGNYVIAGGDFNQQFSTTDSSMYPLISEKMWIPPKLDVNEFSSELSFLQDNSNPTCRSLDKPLAGNDRNNFQYYMIDGFIVSSNVKVEDIHTVNTDFKYTDHNPVILTIVLSKED